MSKCAHVFACVYCMQRVSGVCMCVCLYNASARVACD